MHSYVWDSLMLRKRVKKRNNLRSHWKRILIDHILDRIEVTDIGRGVYVRPQCTLSRRRFYERKSNWPSREFWIFHGEGRKNFQPIPSATISRKSSSRNLNPGKSWRFRVFFRLSERESEFSHFTLVKI